MKVPSLRRLNRFKNRKSENTRRQTMHDEKITTKKTKPLSRFEKMTQYVTTELQKRNFSKTKIGVVLSLLMAVIGGRYLLKNKSKSSKKKKNSKNEGENLQENDDDQNKNDQRKRSKTIYQQQNMNHDLLDDRGELDNRFQGDEKNFGHPAYKKQLKIPDSLPWSPTEDKLKEWGKYSQQGAPLTRINNNQRKRSKATYQPPNHPFDVILEDVD